MHNIQKKIESFKKRWSMTEQSDFPEEFSKFKNRILNVFKDIDSHLPAEAIATFCNALGIPEVWQSGYNHDYSKNVIDALTEERDPKKLYLLIEIIFSLPVQSLAGYGGQDLYSKQILYSNFSEALSFSNIGLSATAKDDDVILYPKGDEELDKKLVEEVLNFLNEASQKHFIDALAYYQQSTTETSIKSAESLRRSLEEFLKFKLKSEKGLAENLAVLQKNLKSDKRDAQIRNIIFSTLSCLDKFYNENSKHNDGDIGDEENEFLIYQTGTLMRYINRVLQ